MHLLVPEQPGGVLDTSDVIAALALVVSVVTAGLAFYQRWRDGRRAEVTAYFQWLDSLSRVPVGDEGFRQVGYHLVLWNRGPSAATCVAVKACGLRSSGEQVPVRLAALLPGEMPLSILDVDGRYPIPWLLDDEADLEFHKSRRFDVELTWRDRRGRRKTTVPLRRGNVRA